MSDLDKIHLANKSDKKSSSKGVTNQHQYEKQAFSEEKEGLQEKVVGYIGKVSICGIFSVIFI